MGLYATAKLVWGVPVLAYDEDTGDPTSFWDDENDDWREFEGEIEVYPYGHYEDPDNQRGILTSARVESFMGECWDSTLVPPDSLIVPEERRAHASIQALDAGLAVNFYADAGWHLVASFG